MRWTDVRPEARSPCYRSLAAKTGMHLRDLTRLYSYGGLGKSREALQ